MSVPVPIAMHTSAANALAMAKAATVQVLDPLSGISSGSLPFSIRTVPAITSATPNPIDAGGPFFQLTVTGTGFAPDSVVNWGGSRLAATLGAHSSGTR